MQAELNEKNLVCINMGQPNFEWDKIPLVKKMDNKNLEIKISGVDGTEITGGFSLSIGNPHVIFFVEDLNKFNLKEIGLKIEHHNYFPEKCNVTLASIKHKNHLKVKVWETRSWFNQSLWNSSMCYCSVGCYFKIKRKICRY